MNYTIRKATLSDLDTLTEIEAVCFPEAEAATRESIEKRLEAFGDHFLIAESEGKAIGFINGCVTDELTIRDEMFEDASLHNPEGRFQSIFGLDVLPEYRCQGIAAALMEALIDQAKKEKRAGLILTCKDRLIHYYNKFGYKNQGISGSTHGGAVWYDMLLRL